MCAWDRGKRPMKISHEQLKQLIEAAIFASDKPLSKEKMKATVLLDFAVSAQALNKVLAELTLDYQPRGIVLRELASGYVFQTADSLSQWLGRLWQETPPRYSRALLETLALIAYRQPITRGEIEQVRGVTVSSNIMKTLQERDWIMAVGHKEVPGRPALYATTKGFLDYFGLSSLSELPDVEAFVAALDEAGQDIGDSASLPLETVTSHDETTALDEISSAPNDEHLH
jgi:segregation and condensation protein B